MLNRRNLLKSSLALPFSGSLASRAFAVPQERPFEAASPPNHFNRPSRWIMPEEGDPHECTWMAFGASRKIWGRNLVSRARKDIARIAQTIAQYEPVVVFVRPGERGVARDSFDDLTNIEFLDAQLNDLWIRDYGGIFVLNSVGDKAAVDFNFNGWGEKQDYAFDAKVAARMARATDVDLIPTRLCAEGGGIEVDGKGTAIITESCVLNENRNPRWSKQQCEAELREKVGIDHVIWLPGVRDADITDGHTDFYARFAKPGVVVAHLESDRASTEFALTRKHLEILKSSKDAKGNRIEVVTIEAPHRVRPRYDNRDFCAGYVNFYVCNDAVICPQFGDKRSDSAAKRTFADLFPNREIRMLDIDGIAAGGGGIHCATQQEPKG